MHTARSFVQDPLATDIGYHAYGRLKPEFVYTAKGNFIR